MVDTHQDEKPNKKKKKHRGYAFVVYEREKDMRGKPMFYSHHNLFRQKIYFINHTPDGFKLPIFLF